MRRNWRSENHAQEGRAGKMENRKWKYEPENRTPLNFRFLFYILFSLTLLACNTGDHSHTTETYTCPMHPTVVKEKPGACPVCGMALVRKSKPGEDIKTTKGMENILQSPNEKVLSSVKTIKGVFKSVPVFLEVQGMVTYDTRKIYSIPSRVGGRLEKIYLKFAYQPVSKGQKMAEMYSPEIITAQRELLFLLENDSENKTLIEAAKKKLQFLGLRTNQISTLIRQKEISNTISIFSPYSGYLITDQPSPSTSPPGSSTTSSSGEMNGMGMGSPPSSPSPAGDNQSSGSISAGSLIREGSYVSAGQTLFNVVNDEALRFELDLPANQAGSIKKGARLELDPGNGEVEEVFVDLVQPFLNEGQAFVKIRVYSKNKEDLHIGHLVKAKIKVPASESLWVPRESVVDLGNEKVVFIKDNGVFNPKVVITGVTTLGLTEIKSGLATSVEIAANAQYLVDSESFIK
jgi:membrane fusion protein, copper/silver efflux system